VTGRSRGLHGPKRGGRLARTTKWVALTLAALVVLAGVYVAVQLWRPVPRPAFRATAAPVQTVRGPTPRLPWPRQGQAAVAVVGAGNVGSAGPTVPVPIASLAKVMTALVVLHDHPLSPGQSGPEVGITPADQAAFQAEQAAGDSVAPVFAGESLSELQLLEGLLIPSADNLALLMAQWDAGSQAAFIAKMNRSAAALGMRSTHYADAGGVSPSTVSTAVDELRLAEVAVANPVLMSIVSQPQVSLPGGFSLQNYDTLLGHDGIIGIKTGSTTAAGGCFMFAAEGAASGRKIEVIGVVLGQKGTSLIGSALQASRVLIHPVLAAFRPVTVLRAGSVVGEVTSPWGSTVPVVARRSVTVLHFGAETVNVAVSPTKSPLPEQLAAGVQVATVTVRAGGDVMSVPAMTSAPLLGPTKRWRLERL
jgi:serine-type D-Ala-D-Ala carboxypeptidase (penicillin-binding protein 5/6)